MEGDLLIFERYSNATLEQILDVIDKYLSKLVLVHPEVSMRVSSSKEGGLEIWKGEIIYQKEWGKPDDYWGYAQVKPEYAYSPARMKVSLYSSHPVYVGYWQGLQKTLIDHLKFLDVSQFLTEKPWESVPDHGYDRKMLELWRQGYSANEIAKRVEVGSGKTIHNRISSLRKKYGEKIVPLRQKWRSKEELGNAGN